MRKLDEPSLKLVGFKLQKLLQPYHNYRSSYFLYPDDELVENSCKISKALIIAMLKKEKMAIIRFIPSKA